MKVYTVGPMSVIAQNNVDENSVEHEHKKSSYFSKNLLFESVKTSHKFGTAFLLYSSECSSTSVNNFTNAGPRVNLLIWNDSFSGHIKQNTDGTGVGDRKHGRSPQRIHLEGTDSILCQML